MLNKSQYLNKGDKKKKLKRILFMYFECTESKPIIIMSRCLKLFTLTNK